MRDNSSSRETSGHNAHEHHFLLLLARGEQEIAAGKGFDLDEVLAEADALLADGLK